MPAEWETHASTWFTWPRPEGISFPDKYDTVPPVYAELIRHLVQVEEVNINVWDGKMESWVKDLLRQHNTPLERVRFHHFPAYEPWCRDHGPIFLFVKETETMNGQLWIGVTMPGEINIRLTIWMMQFRSMWRN